MITDILKTSHHVFNQSMAHNTTKYIRANNAQYCHFKPKPAVIGVHLPSSMAPVIADDGVRGAVSLYPLNSPVVAAVPAPELPYRDVARLRQHLGHLHVSGEHRHDPRHRRPLVHRALRAGERHEDDSSGLQQSNPSSGPASALGSTIPSACSGRCNQLRIQRCTQKMCNDEMYLQCASDFRADMSLLVIVELGKPEIGDLGGEIGIDAHTVLLVKIS